MDCLLPELAVALALKDETGLDPREKELELILRVEWPIWWLALKVVFCGTLLMTEGRSIDLVPELAGLKAILLAGTATL